MVRKRDEKDDLLFVAGSTLLGSIDCGMASFAPATRRAVRIFKCIVAGFLFLFDLSCFHFGKTSTSVLCKI